MATEEERYTNKTMGVALRVFLWSLVATVSIFLISMALATARGFLGI